MFIAGWSLLVLVAESETSISNEILKFAYFATPVALFVALYWFRLPAEKADALGQGLGLFGYGILVIIIGFYCCLGVTIIVRGSIK